MCDTCGCKTDPTMDKCTNCGQPSANCTCAQQPAAEPVVTQPVVEPTVEAVVEPVVPDSNPVV